MQTILNVDDDHAGRYVVTTLLRRAGFEVLEAENGQKALMLAAQGPDLILLDVNLPDIDGFEVCKRLKSDPATSSIPVIHLSATRTDSSSAVQGLEGGADLYLAQPVDPGVLLSTVRAFLRARRAEAELAKTAKELDKAVRDWQVTFDSIGDALCLVDTDGARILRNNDSFDALLKNDLKPETLTQLCSVAREELPLNKETWHKNGIRLGNKSFDISFHPVMNGTGVPSKFVVLFKDVTFRKEAETALRLMDERLHAILDNTTAAIYIIDKNQRFLLANRSFERMLGIPVSEVLGKTIHEVFPADLAAQYAENNRLVLDSRRPVEFEETAPHGDELHTYISMKVPLFDETSAPYAICGISADITDRKRAEENLKMALQEKDVLIQEIHHRVKNNLQVVRSLLSLQSSKISDPAIQKVFSESRDRIQAMALVHETLYSTHGSRGVDLSVYLHSLCTQLMRSYNVNSNVQLVFHSDPVFVDINRAVPLGLIINELLSNSLKYAFPRHQTGKVTIVLKRRETSAVEVLIGDNGIGMPDNVDLPNVESLGLKLVRLLVRQLEGNIEWVKSEPGTVYRIVFQQ